jgi:hypothetical protein
MRTRNTSYPWARLGACISMLFLVGVIILQPLKSTHAFAGQAVRSASVRPAPTPQPTQPALAIPATRPGPGPDRTFTPGINAQAQSARPASATPAEARQASTDRSANRLGQLRIDVPENVDVGTPFNMDIWIDFDDPSYSGSVKVFMEQTDKVQYDPRVFESKPNERTTVKVTVVKAPSGLALIRASGSGLDDLVEPLDANFSVKLKPNNLDQTLVSGAVANINFDFVNGKGEPVALDARVKLSLQSANLSFRSKQTDPWTDTVEIDVPQNYTSSPAVQVKPRWLWSPSNALLGVSARIANESNSYTFVVHNENVKFNVVPRWWLPLVVAILGGIIFSLYQAAQDWIKSSDSKARRIAPILITRILPGVIAGALAYFLVNMNILGIKIDTTALQGFLVLGFLFAYVGIDTILKLVTKKDAGPPQEKDKAVPTAGVAPAH